MAPDSHLEPREGAKLFFSHFEELAGGSSHLEFSNGVPGFLNKRSTIKLVLIKSDYGSRS